MMLPVRFWLALGWLVSLFFGDGFGARAVAYAQVTPVPGVVIVAPEPSQVLQGVVAILGRTTLNDFQSAELLFGYANDPTQTWFFIAESTTPVEAGLLAEWDTSTLTDGNYTLRLVVYRADGSRVVVIVPGLRIRNYSAVETDTPTPLPSITPVTLPQAGTPKPPTMTVLPADTPVPATITPLPTNPAEITQRDVSRNLLQGAAGTGIALASLGLYLAIRKLLHR